MKKIINWPLILFIGLTICLPASFYLLNSKNNNEIKENCYKKIEFTLESQKNIEPKYYDIIWDNLEFKNQKLTVINENLTEEEKQSGDYDKETEIAKIKFTKDEFENSVRLGLADINKDGLNDYLYEIQGRFGYPNFCGNKGCSLFILVSQKNGSYKHVECPVVFIGPICVLKSETDEFKNIELLNYTIVDKQINIIEKSILKFDKNENVYNLERRIVK
ncbi:MAG: hypothetical protein UT30_C0044G0004 [Candidatus Uhrbacteria bacterium GW2011_GWF2_39_13]|uniref:Uncharacterized protein n=1 Tax=Candidatus Uhrbacteria bacterium GW2011_GWF2_39_13 TaxID=1618995 RepID=A0A0G0MIF1_9BACT|nr:MAG: hypothetical protein UT30_C0044G0004 [Candidatus Uhrbacteria bacterium GW2011_GWF2_39_13]